MMDSPMNVLAMVLKGGRVKRFHTKPLVKEETNAEHMYVVAWLATIVTGSPSAALLLACLSHDQPEYLLGDVPSPTKIRLGMSERFREEESNLFKHHGMPDYEALLSEAEAEVLHFCDSLAGWLKCLYEERMGNTFLTNTSARYCEYLKEKLAASKHLNTEACIYLIKQIERNLP